MEFNSNPKFSVNFCINWDKLERVVKRGDILIRKPSATKAHLCSFRPIVKLLMSMAQISRMGDNGYPCLVPLRIIISTSLPLMFTHATGALIKTPNREKKL